MLCSALVFNQGNTETKKRIFFSLGSNLKLKDGIVLVDLGKPLGWIENTKHKVSEITTMFELRKKALQQAKWPLIIPKIQFCSSTKDFVFAIVPASPCNYLMDSHFKISNPSIKNYFKDTRTGRIL